MSVEVLMQGEVPHPETKDTALELDGLDVAVEERVESAMDDGEVDREHGTKAVDGACCTSSVCYPASTSFSEYCTLRGEPIQVL